MASLLKSRWVWALVVAVGVASVAVWHLASRSPLDSRSRTIFAGATKVEVFLLDGKNGPFDDDGRPRTAGERRLDGFLVTAQGQDRGKDFADRLAGILADRRTYTRDSAICFWPGVAFRVWKGEECVDVLVCFMCENLYCGPPTEEGRENASFGGSPRRADLLRLAKEAFPENKEIQALK